MYLFSKSPYKINRLTPSVPTCCWHLPKVTNSAILLLNILSVKRFVLPLYCRVLFFTAWNTLITHKLKNAPKSANSYFKKSIKWHLSVPRNNLSRNVFIKPHDSVLNVHNQVMCFWPYTRHTQCDVSSLNPMSFQFCQDVVYGGRGNISRTKCPQW